MLEVESIEVLRGPQGTLYGAGAEAGAINITTKKPHNQTQGKVSVVIGNDKKRRYALNASTLIIEDQLYLSFVVKHDEKEGYIKNLISGNMMNDKESQYGKLYLLYIPY
ncbi:MAG: hypothetical protein K0U47_02885 [Epsilonproteobacteria bacterium]|nr:hypothetical protein [Campylobacterota bacterium]